MGNVWCGEINIDSYTLSVEGSLKDGLTGRNRKAGMGSYCGSRILNYRHSTVIMSTTFQRK